MDRRTFLQSVMMSAAASVIAACTPQRPDQATSGAGQAAATSAPKAGGTYRDAVTTDPDTLDPHVTSNPASSTVFGSIYSTLVFQDMDRAYKPLLAERMDLGADNRSITFTLRQGVKFTNGEPLDANAVKFTFTRLQQIGTKSPLFETAKNLESIDVVDARTVRFTLNTPQATIFHDLATAYAGILSPKAVNDGGDGYGRRPVGSGPYALEDWKTGQQVTLVRNADFAWPEPFYTNRGAPYIERYTHRVVPEPATVRQLFDAGELEVMALTAADATKYDQDPKAKTYKLPVGGIGYLGFNCQKPPFNERTMRQALSHAIDKDEIVKVGLGGELGQVINTPLPPSVWGYDETLAQSNYQHDPQKAKQLLAQLGYAPGADGMLAKDGQPFRPLLYTDTSASRAKVLTVVQSQLKSVGVDIQVRSLEAGALAQATPKGEHDILLYGWNWNEPDALFLFLSKTRLQSSNRVLFVNDEFEDLITRGRQEMQQDRRLALYKDAQKLVLQEAPWQPLYMPIAKVAVSARIQGVKVHPSGDLLLHDAYFSG